MRGGVKIRPYYTRIAYHYHSTHFPLPPHSPALLTSIIFPSSAYEDEPGPKNSASVRSGCIFGESDERHLTFSSCNQPECFYK